MNSSTPHRCIFLLAAVCLASGVTPVLAQSGGGFNLSANVIAGGGGSSSSGVHTLNSTIGQPVAGTTQSGGQFSLTAGFGAVVQASTSTPTPTPTPSPTPTPTPAPIQLILEQSGPDPNQAASLDSLLFLRDPFLVVNGADLLEQGVDQNTRIIIFVTNLQLEQGETASSVVVSLIDANSISHDIEAEEVRAVPNSSFTQVIIRLPDNLPVGTCSIVVKAHGQTSNSGTLRIRS